ncbi:GNAT family N-acetyltransferase [Rheinheimera maricola]|uniref:N-acetyltransferase n=1 Tax=Rheinheimera maricola TaxID=2793282 RepID=A0ABS7XBI1_9GAMM|nr:N-acetyltransferase [Rheinheimera maricola]MBZ9612910.1 N-acetyltransferase [Rheinheimera maricola]
MTLLHNISRTLQRRRNATWHALGYDTTVRAESAADFDAIAHITRTAFNNEAEVTLISALRQQSNNCIALVAEQHNKVIGHILFSPATLSGAPNCQIMALAPMAVSQILQHQGVGSALVRSGLEQCKQRGIAAVVVLGHPAYYARFGFLPASKFGISCPWQVPDEAFMLLELQQHSLRGEKGQVLYHPAFSEL